MSNSFGNKLNASCNEIIDPIVRHQKIDASAPTALKTQVEYLKINRVIKSEDDQMDYAQYIPEDYQTGTIIVSHDLHRTDDFITKKGDKSNAVAVVKASAIKSYLETNIDAFETTRYAEECRAFIDIDGVCDPSIEEEDFNLMDSCITANLINSCSDYKISFMSSSSYNIRKKGCPILSYEIVFPEVKGVKLAIKKWVKDSIVPKIKEAVGDEACITIGEEKASKSGVPVLNIDMSVYEKAKKMRMWNSCKTIGDHTTFSRDFNRKIIKANLEARPKTLVEGDVIDTLITYIPSGVSYTTLKDIDIEIAGLGRINTSKPPSPVRSEASFSTELSEEQLTIIKAVNGLNISRCMHYREWRNIGWAMCSINIPISYYREWSMKAINYSAGCENGVYSSYKGGDRKITQATIWYYLQTDNYDLFRELMPKRKDVFRLVDNNCQASCAETFYNMKPDNYMYLDEQGWYVLNSRNTWDYSKNIPSSLLTDIYKTFNTLKLQTEEAIIKQQRELDRSDDAQYKTDNEALEEKKKALCKFIKQCGTAQFGRGITDYLKALYTNNKRMEIMDSNTHLFACNNKVYDCNTLKWRDIVPTDYISLTTGYSYDPRRNEEIQSDILQFFSSCFHTKDDALYYLMTVARCLNGNRKGTGEFFYILTGNGGNGKGLSVDLIKRVFGSGDFGYFKVFNASTLTKVQDKANAPMTDIYKSRGGRFVCASEPEMNDTLQGGLIKGLTGGDAQEVRDLHKSTISFVPQFGLFIQANNIPKIKLDGGILRRIKIINFPFDFKATPNPEISTQKEADPELAKRLSTDEYRLEFLHILTYIYEAYLSDGGFIKDTENVISATKEYIEKNNPVGKWLEEKYNKCSVKEDSGFHEAREMYNTFKVDTGIEMSEYGFANLMKLNDVVKEKVSTYQGRRNIQVYKCLLRIVM